MYKVIFGGVGTLIVASFLEILVWESLLLDLFSYFIHQTCHIHHLFHYVRPNHQPLNDLNHL